MQEKAVSEGLSSSHTNHKLMAVVCMCNTLYRRTIRYPASFPGKRLHPSLQRGTAVSRCLLVLPPGSRPDELAQWLRTHPPTLLCVLWCIHPCSPSRLSQRALKQHRAVTRFSRAKLSTHKSAPYQHLLTSQCSGSAWRL